MAEMDLDELEQENDEDEGEVLTPSQVLEKLEEAWVNEKFSPELQEVQGEVLDCMLEQIATMEENVSRARPGDFRVPIHRMEIDRIRYVITSYLRCRLKKIEKFTAQVLEKETAREEDDNPLMTPGELQFAKQSPDETYAFTTDWDSRRLEIN